VTAVLVAQLIDVCRSA